MKSRQLLQFFEAGLPDSLLLLKRLVEMESCSCAKAGVDALAALLVKEFSARGADAGLIEEAERGNLLRATWRGAPRPVMVLGHIDTVWPTGTVRQRPFRIVDGNAFGPGVFDMKAGVLLALLACDAFRRGHIDPGKEVRFFFTSDEEIGTEAGLSHLREAASSCSAVICLEPPLSGGKAKTFRKGVSGYRIRVHGISSHAGVDHAGGANAIAELCRHVLSLQAMTDYDRGISVSVGKIRGGAASNVVPAEAEAEVDVRAATGGDLNRMDDRIRSLKPHDGRCTIVIDGGVNRPPLERTDGVIGLFHKAREVAAEFGMNLAEGSTGGGSDGSFTASMGIPTLDGLGVNGEGAHAEHEHIEIADIPRRAALLCRLIQAIET